MRLVEFKPQSLRYFFSPKTVACCKSVVLFINKSDLIAGTPAQVEKRARELYQTLIDSIQKYATQIDVKVFVGSASSGHSTHLLFSHFVERILPKNAYDQQLLQRMKAEWRVRPPVQGARNTLPLNALAAVHGENAGVPAVSADFMTTAPILGEPMAPYGRG